MPHFRSLSSRFLQVAIFSAALTTVLMAGLACPSRPACAAELAPGSFGADAIFVHPVGGSGDISDSVRAAISIAPVYIDTNFAKVEILPGEFTVSNVVATGDVELTRFKAAALRLAFNRVMPVELLTVYRNLDRGIEYGGNVISVRVPVRITSGGELIVQPGLELGFRHYVTPIDETELNASFVLEARAAKVLIENFMSTGVMARVRYDLESGDMGGFSEEAMGYLSFLLDRDHRLYARVYAGVDRQRSRERLGLPTIDIFSGVGVYGNFGK